MLKYATAAAAALALAAPAAANAGFKEPVHVIWQHTGSAGNYFGWAVSPLADVNHDGAADAIIGEPGFDQGTTWLLSGRTGRVMRSFDGQPGDANGYAIADAGDVNRDARPDVLIGAPAHTGGGMAYVYSGRTYKLLYRIPAPDPAHAFGAGTGTTRDVDGDRIPDEIVGGGGAGYVFSGANGALLYGLQSSAAARQFGTFFLAGVGDVNHDHVPDVYGGDYAAGDNGPLSGFAGVYSGRDGTLLHSWFGAEPGAGLGPGRSAGDVDHDHTPDLAIGSYQSDEGAPDAGKIEIYSGATGAKLRTITSTTAGENLGFDAVGMGDVNRDHRPDLLASAAEGDTVYMIAGERGRHSHHRERRR
jgi:FG-GAP repeat